MAQVSKYASLRLLASGPVLLASLTCLRLASGPAQPATRHPASGPSVYETGLAHPATRPSTAQPSLPSPSSRRNQQRSPAARQPATHPWLRSLVAETSFRPSPTSNPPQPSLPNPGPGASQGMPATRPAPSSQPTSRLSPA